ncbi:MAG: peptidoglycan-binding domain-containing protein [Dehalococcoidia bacterium]
MGAATRLRSIRRPIAWAAVAAVLSAGVAGGAWLARDDGDKVDTANLVTANVRLWTFFETAPVQLTLGYEPLGEVLAPRAGTVTGMHMDEGRSAQPGFKIMTIDGRPVVSAVGTVPFARPLSSGSEGEDVGRLQELLKEEGYYDGDPTGRFDAATDAALRERQEQHAYPVDGVFLPGDVALGAWPALVAPIFVRAGDVVTAGEPVAELSAPGLYGRIAPLDGQPLPEMRPGVLVRWDQPGARGQGNVHQLDDGSWGVFPVYSSSSAAGQVVDARVALRVLSDQLAVPPGSIQRDGAETYVEVLEAGEALRKVRVEQGLTDGEYVQVTGDLQPGQALVLAAGGERDASDVVLRATVGPRDCLWRRGLGERWRAEHTNRGGDVRGGAARGCALACVRDVGFTRLPGRP